MNKDYIENISCYAQGGKLRAEARIYHSPLDNAPTCIYLLGALQDISTIKPFTTEISKYFNYIIVEVPGSGQTDPLDPKTPFEAVAEFLDHIILKKVGKSPVTIMACSYGTATAVAFAKQHPERVERLVLCGSMYEIPERTWPQLFKIINNAYNNKADFAKSFLDLLIHPISSIAEKQAQIYRVTLRKTKGFQDRHYQHFIYNTIRLMAHDPGTLSNIECPTLVLTGEYDPFCTVNDAQQLADHFPDGEFEPLIDCDHLFHIEDPHQVIEKVLAFILRTDYKVLIPCGQSDTQMAV